MSSPAWLLAGQTGVVEYLTNRPQSAAQQYALDHPFVPPYYAELDNAPPPIPDVTMAPSGGNPPEHFCQLGEDFNYCNIAEISDISGLQ